MLILFSLLALCGALPLRATVPWLPFGPDGGDARRIATDPRNTAHLFLGTANGWMYESRNTGASWKRVARVGNRDDLVLDSILVDPKDSKHLIVGAWVIDHPDGGIYISYDGGASWLNQAEMRGQSVRALARSASDPRIMVAGTLQGLFRSNDGGQRWKQISPKDSVEIHNIQSAAIDPKDPNIIFLGTWHLPWKTTDGGDHWDNMGTPQGIIDDSDVFSIIIDPVTPQTVFASACSGIYKSLNGGEHFDKVQGIPATARRTRVLLQDPNHLQTVFAGTTEGLFRSDDTGKTWTRTTGPEIIVNDVSIDKSDSRHVLIATNRGGVMASDDGGDSFHSSNGGFSARQVTTLKRDSRRPATLYVGVVNDKEWGGVFQSDNGGLSWAQHSQGLQGRDVFSIGQSPGGTLIAGTSHGLYRLSAATSTWERVVHAPTGNTDSDSAATPPTPTTRPPVPLVRNIVVHHVAAKPLTPAQRRAAAVKTKHTPVTARSKAATTPAARRAQALAAKKHGTAPKTTAVHARVTVAKPQPPPVVKTEPLLPPPAPAAPPSFDGKVNNIATVGQTILPPPSTGLLPSIDDGETWTDAQVPDSADWRYLSTAKMNVVAASFHTISFSSNGGRSWAPIHPPDAVTEISAVAVDPAGEVWVGGRQGVFVSSDAGLTWTTPKNLYVSAVSNLFYDEATDRLIVTTTGTDSIVFTVQLPQRQIKYAYSGWSLRLARPVGDHIVAATLFDGIVVEPKVVDAPATPKPATPQPAQ